MTTLLIARHGNTFAPGEVVRRAGAGTDIPLVESGRAQGTYLGQFLAQENLIPDLAYSSHLKRAKETANLALDAMGLNLPITEDKIFNEIDYGPDEGKPEEEVIARLGIDVLKAWDKDAIVPNGWNVTPDELILGWMDFGKTVAANYAGKTILVVTSNGIARFAPYLTGDFDGFKQNHNIKLSTGAVSKLNFDGTNWSVDFWNSKPAKILNAA